ncbi:MAG: hypothetical protein C4340_02790, partial [Armatimonadota bacterium]
MTSRRPGWSNLSSELARYVRIALLFLFALAALGSAVAQQAKANLRFDVRSAKPGAVVPGVVEVRIPTGLHANQNPPNVDGFIPVSISLKTGGTLVSAEYPKGKMKTFGFSDEPLAVYEGNIRIPIRVRLPANAQGEVPVEVAVQVQMCDDSSCFPPDIVTASASLTIERDETPLTNTGSSRAGDTAPPKHPPAQDREDVLRDDTPVSSNDQRFDMEDGAAPGLYPQVDAAPAETVETQERPTVRDPLA